ncbi:ABC transporter ATP-binding protein [Litoribacillus peritrichatus]|uniref:ABC transporter domain-containing protein n=1 Tax=Litoribacillus peritrichatus TaxID=718191 RepID=A0ABP7N610_9GAMM
MTSKNAPLLSCTKLTFSYPKNVVLDNISLEFGIQSQHLNAQENNKTSGEFVGLIGANGAGKSTLLKLLTGISKPNQGEVTLSGASLKTFKRKLIAQYISFVPQDTSIDYAFSVREVVAMGRHPHLKSFEPEGEYDQSRIMHAMEKTDLLKMADRSVTELSGGERQRVFIARALAQETPILILDEPTASLDLCHQLEVLALLKTLAREGHVIITAIHDLNMAARFCDRLIILANQQVVADGKPEEILTESHLRQHFSVEARVDKSDEDGFIRITALQPVSHICSA